MRVWKMHAFTEVWDNKKKIDIENLKKKNIWNVYTLVIRKNNIH